MSLDTSRVISAPSGSGSCTILVELEIIAADTRVGSIQGTGSRVRWSSSAVLDIKLSHASHAGPESHCRYLCRSRKRCSRSILPDDGTTSGATSLASGQPYITYRGELKSYICMSLNKNYRKKMNSNTCRLPGVSTKPLVVHFCSI